MADVEIKRKIQLSRKQAGERLIALGKSLVDGAKAELETGGDSIHFTVADKVAWEFELEVDGDELELEIELKWSTAAPAAPAASAAPAAAQKRTKSARRGAGKA
jgi:amphi-Trp domain-containing protein